MPDFLRVVLHVWDKSCERGDLPRPFRTAAVSLIYKKGPADTLDNYRPISVLPTAYKIVTKALAMRLADLMSAIVPPNQTGFIKGRDIRTNILEAHLAKATAADGPKDWTYDPNLWAELGLDTPDSPGQPGG